MREVVAGAVVIVACEIAGAERGIELAEARAAGAKDAGADRECQLVRPACRWT